MSDPSTDRVDQALEAVRAGDRDRLEDLLTDDPSLAASRGDDGVSLLLTALYHRQPDLARLLAERRPAEEPLDLFEATALGDEVRLAELLRRSPERVGEIAPDGFTALHLAGFFGQADAVALLLEHGAPLDRRTDNPMAISPLGSAVAGRDRFAVRLLVDAGADVTIAQTGGFTPLMGAASAGRSDLVGLLLDAGADPAVAADDGRTAADLAAEHGHDELAGRLRTLSSSV